MWVAGLRWLAVLLLVLAVAPAQAVNYTFPGTLPAGCSGSGPSYTCTNLTLAWHDRITIASPKPATITVNGDMSTDTSTINATGVASDLSLVVTGTLTTKDWAVINANVTAGTVNGVGIAVNYGGSVTATSGSLFLADQAKVAGSVSSGSGAITIDNESVISGSVSSTSGAIWMQFGASVVGDVTTSGTVTLDGEVVASACVRSTNSAAIKLDWHSAVAGVCCGSGCSSACVTNNSGYATPAACAPLPPPTTCITDKFSAGLNPALWSVSGSGYTPQVVTSPTVPSSRLRLTDNGGNRATMAQLKKWFPAANNKVVIEFDYYDYGGSGADGVGVVLSDASVPPTAGGYGGSLGYANRGGVNGFNGGWLGVGLDEFGNYPNSTESRRGYPAGFTPPVGANSVAGFYASSIGVRGSGVAQASGYQLLANTGVLTPSLTTTNAVPQRYRVTMNHSNSTNAYVTVERNTGSGYTTVVPAFDVRGASTGQAAVPTNMLLSFTGSTGGSTNYHEIGNVSVCATHVTDPGGSANAANFECLETGVLPTWSNSARHPLYTKLADTDFKFDIVALKSDGSIENGYVSAGGNPKNVTVELFDDSASPSPVCSAYASPVATQSVIYASGDGGRKTIGGNINLAKAWRKLRCRVTDTNVAPTVYGCSTDTFSVRPQSFAVQARTSGDVYMSTSPSNSATPTVKAGADFKMYAETNTLGYDGTPLISSSGVSDFLGSTTANLLSGVFGAASSTNGMAYGTSFKYGEVGYFVLADNAVYADQTFVDSGAKDFTNGDCISSSISNTKTNGKYGCNVGSAGTTWGRFIPDHFTVKSSLFTPGCIAGSFSYMGQPFSLNATIEARNLGGVKTQNYTGSYANGAVSVQMENADSGVPIANTRLGGLGTPAWAAGSYSFVATQFLRLAGGPDGPYDLLDIGLAVADEGALAAASRPYLTVRDMDASSTTCTVDMSGLSIASGVCTATRIASAAKIRYGRMRLSNQYASALPLKIPVQTQYWSGLSWVNNGLDSCTALADGNISLSNQIPAGWTSSAPGTLSGGGGFITLTPPASARSGSLALCADLGADNGVVCSNVSAGLPWLQSRWPGGAGYDNDPSAQATFGIYSPEGKKGIFNRELY